jgi:hypothetical protein
MHNWGTLMSEIEVLIARLERINADTLRDFTPTKPTTKEDIATIQQRLATIGGRGGGDLPPDFPARIPHAVAALRGGQKIDYPTLRTLCAGCCHYIEPDDYTVVGEPNALQTVLTHVGEYTHDQRRFRQLFDGLRRSYLEVNRNEKRFQAPLVKTGTEVLRMFLADNLDRIDDHVPAPDWARTLRSYRAILSCDPGSPFAQGWLDGQHEEFKEVKMRLEISGTAWLVTEPVRSALEIAIKQNDRLFTAYIPELLKAANTEGFLRDEIYSGLLTRYSEITGAAVHPSLRDAVVVAWKNPWLARNDSAWGRVQGKARRMVTGWLKLELIHQFFEVLSEDGRQDKRRFEFWRGYHDKMDGVSFALSREAFASPSTDLVKFKTAADGLISQLAGSTSDNHAFVMQMGDVVAVEFSKHGNAAFLHNRHDFLMGPADGTIHIEDLRRNCLERLLHKPARGYSWEERFSHALNGVQSVTPPQVTAQAIKAVDIMAFARSHGIMFEDHRANGGSLWLLTDSNDPRITDPLPGWGFKYRAGKGWWKSQ